VREAFDYGDITLIKVEGLWGEDHQQADCIALVADRRGQNRSHSELAAASQIHAGIDL
jgi:hypothetical protein